MRGADRIVVNSNFTKGVVEGVWQGLGGERGIGVVYPCVDTGGGSLQKLRDEGRPQDLWTNKKVLLSINRFERKKGIDLALRAFARLKASERSGVRLVVAGGYDTRVPENVAYHKELESLAGSLGLKAATAKNVVSAQAVPEEIEILFLLSVPDQLKSSLLASAKLLVYTPSDEHFGIVPLEAMLAGVPVLASNSGGPLETVLDGKTGWLRSVDKIDQWTEVMFQVLYEISESALQAIAETATKHVREGFSKTKMALRLKEEIDAMLKAPRQQATELGDVGIAAILWSVAIVSIGVVIKEGVRTDVVNGPREIAAGVGIITLALLAVSVVTWKLMQNESAFT